MNSTKELYKTRAIQLFIFSFILTTIAFAFIGVMFWNHYESSKEITKQTVEVENIEGEILLYDEMLTMSARMYTSTGNTEWEERYNKTVPLLDSALVHAEKVAPLAFKTAIDKTGKANQALIEKETKAFELTKEGNKELAYTTISDIAYQEYKKTYAEGMEDMTQAMKEEVYSLQQKNESRATLASTITLIIVPFLLFVWYNTLRLIRNYISTQNQLQLEITAQNEGLEQKVIERTTEIQEKNEKLQSSEEELKQNLEELQTTQDELSEQTQQLAAINNALDQSTIVSVADKQGRILKVNDKFCEVSQYTKEELFGKDHNIVNSGNHPKEFWQNMWQTISRGNTWRGEIKNKAKDGTIYWVDTVINPLMDNQNKIKGYLSIRNLITEKKQAEESLIENIEKLQTTQDQLQNQKEKIELSYKELQSTQKQLIQSEKMASLGHLIASIAHEINTPLGAIRSSADSIETILLSTLPNFSSFIQKLDSETLSNFNEFVKIASLKKDMFSTREKRKIKYDLIDKLEEKSIAESEELADFIVNMNMQDEKILIDLLLQSEHRREIFDTAYHLSTIIRSNQIIREATNRAAKTVFALKNFARQDHTGEKTNLNINETLETTLTLYYNQTKLGIDVKRNLGDIPIFLGYPDEIMQVWTNLIHNAIQAMKGKGKLFVSTKINENKEQVRSVLVSIQDTGGGVPKEIQDKIFDAFFTTKGVGEGSGLGLDITKKIIAKHDGKIWFESEVGIGTTFFIEIPIN